MADANTTLMGLVKPEVGASSDTWGQKINTNLDLADLLFAVLSPVQHRLSLTTAVPVTTSDVTAATTVYMTPDKGNGIVNFDGVYWDVIAQSELSMALSSDSGHTGYHQSGKIFDVFYFDDAGTKRIGTGPAWTNDTTRASAISRLNGVYVNTSSMTVRFGSASGNTVTVAASRGTYLGTIYCTANGQTEDSLAKRMVWNCYNRRPRAMRVLEATNSWTYSTGSYRQANNSATNQLAFVRGLNEDAVAATASAQVATSTTAQRDSFLAIGLDSTTDFAPGNSPTWASLYTGTPSVFGAPNTHYRGFPGLGYHYLAWLERGAGADTQTWYGDNNGPTVQQSGIFGEVWA